MSSKLTKIDEIVIREEEENIEKFLTYHVQNQSHNKNNKIMEQIVMLRDSLSQANEDDIPHIVEQIDRLSAILNFSSNREEEGLDRRNPYFAHMKLKVGERTLNFYIGTKVFRSDDGKLQIVDWKRSPISKVYYLYYEGDEFEEVIGDRLMEGILCTKRAIKVSESVLVQIVSKETIYTKNNRGEWIKNVSKPVRLRGGVGAASRPDSFKKLSLSTLETSNQRIEKDRYLPEISALLDPVQFEIISKPNTGIIAIQGSAGSGKTTIALHRVAWLHEQDKKRFNPARMVIFVFNKALARYIAKVLPSLDVFGVQVLVYESWASKTRIQFVGHKLPKVYSDRTPVAAIRIKKHPVMLRIIEEFSNDKEQEFTNKLKIILAKHGRSEFPLPDILNNPILKRILDLKLWIENRKKIAGNYYSGNPQLTLKIKYLIEEYIDVDLSREENLVAWWEEMVTDFDSLRKYFKKFASDIHPEIINQGLDWIRNQYILLSNKDNYKDYNKEIKDQLREQNLIEKPCLDYEDDPILLRLYQKLIGPILTKKKKPLIYNHMVIDEAQDLGPLELKVLLDLSSKEKSITLAGDVNQKLIQFNGFDEWEQVFKCLGLEGEKISPLNVSYRSTAQIMSFAFELLGEEKNPKEIFAQREGDTPAFFRFSNQGEMLFRISENLKKLVEAEPLSNAVLICAQPEDASRYFHLLKVYEIPNLRYVGDQDFKFTSGIDITDIKQVKGLEFDYVLILDVDTVNYPDNSYSRFLLHIGSTRAAHQLWIMSYRNPSEVLPHWIVNANAEHK